jgi:nucleoside-diphosphate-sugar epimerase
MKRILVTGASGRVGRALVPRLLEKGYGVRVTVNRHPLPDAWRGEVESVEGPFTDDGTLAQAVADTACICHLAGLMPPASDDEMFRTNIEFTYRLLQAAARLAIKPRFLFASSDATYCTGWSKGPWSSPIDENTPQNPMLFYGVSKVLGERLCFHIEDICQLPTVRLRLVWILEASEVLDLFLSAPYKEYLEDASIWNVPDIVPIPREVSGHPFTEHICDVRDAAEGIILALEQPAATGQTFNIAGPAPFSYDQLSPWLAERLGRKSVPGLCRGIHSYEVSIAKARGMLGYQPKYSVYESLEDALARRQS